MKADYFIKELGEVIREFRKRLKLSQKEVANKLEVSESTVRMWELGKNNISAKDLYLLSDVLKTTSIHIFFVVDVKLLLREMTENAKLRTKI